MKAMQEANDLNGFAIQQGWKIEWLEAHLALANALHDAVDNYLEDRSDANCSYMRQAAKRVGAARGPA